MADPYSISDSWCQHIPMLHRALADPVMVGQLPQATDDLRLEEACACWETLHYLLTALLGWESPGHGLAWWYQAGRPEDDPLLKLALKHWDAHSMLD